MPGLFVLLCNDDGVDALGLRSFVEAFLPIGLVAVAAPPNGQSGKGHGLLLRDPVFVTERKPTEGSTWYAIDGSYARWFDRKSGRPPV